MAKSFVQLVRSEDTAELMKCLREFILLALIAYRAKRTGAFNPFGLKTGEALIGDHKACGLTRQQYRTALKNLKIWGFITTRTTNKGTIAKIINSSVFDINAKEANHQTNQKVTADKSPGNLQLTTNKNEKNIENEKEINILVGFDQFWRAYPKKKSKGQAEKTWLKLIKTKQLPEIKTLLDAIAAQKAGHDWQKDSGQFIPYPATWLNAKGWEDETSGPDTTKTVTMPGDNITYKGKTYTVDQSGCIQMQDGKWMAPGKINKLVDAGEMEICNSV